MKARFVHRCTHVIDKQKTIEFYEKALGFHVVRESGPADGSWTNTFMESDACPFQLELTWNRGRTEPYDNGGRDQHIAFVVDDFDAMSPHCQTCMATWCHGHIIATYGRAADRHIGRASTLA